MKSVQYKLEDVLVLKLFGHIHLNTINKGSYERVLNPMITNACTIEESIKATNRSIETSRYKYRKSAI